MVAQANVRERTAHHDLMVTTARAVRVEFMRLHAVGDQVFPRGRIHGNRTSRRNVIGGDAVAKNRQHLGAVNVRQRRRCFRHVVEIRRKFDIGRFRIPLVNVALRNGHGLPVRVALEDFAVLPAILRRRNRSANGRFDFLRRRPDISQIDRLAGGIIAERFARQVHIHAARKRVGDDERRRGQIIRANQRMNAALEIAVAAQDRDGNQIVVLDGRADSIRQRTAIADAGRTSVADQMKIQFLQIRCQTRRLQVIGHDFRTGRKAGFDPRLNV